MVSVVIIGIACRNPVLRMIEGREVGHRSPGRLGGGGEYPSQRALGQIEDTDRLVRFVLDIFDMRVAVGEAGIDVVVHRARGELELEVGLVLDRVAPHTGIGVVVLGLVVAAEVIVERIVHYGEIIRGLERLDDLSFRVQGVRPGARRLIDQNAVVEHRGSGQIHLRPVAGNRSDGGAREVRSVVDEPLVDPIDAVVFAVTRVLEAARDQHGVLRRVLHEHRRKQRLLMKIHVVVVAAAVVAGETHACSDGRRQRPVQIEGRAPFLLAVELQIECGGISGERGHLGGDVDRAPNARRRVPPGRWPGP